MPDEIKARYFTHATKEYEIAPEVKNLVTFERRNLKDDFSRIGVFDVIFMRNVTIYFGANFREELLERVAKALKPGGYLFLGSSESLPERCGAFSMHTSGGALYYRRAPGGDQRRAAMTP
ncbi:MAG: methyltransferase domain-containing protein [Nitrospinae bacterium]|nr:methyltransferase domain-containing protein [Nitrospinota bacterium]